MKTYEPAEVLHQETVYLTPWVWGLVLGVLVALVGVLISVILVGVSDGDWMGLLISLAVTVVLAFLLWNYRAIGIRVTRRQFEARYGVLHRTVIPLSEVTECLVTRANFGRYFGIGVRVGLDGSRAYTTSFGPAVEIRRRSGRPFVVSTDRPEELCRSIKAALVNLRP